MENRQMMLIGSQQPLRVHALVAVSIKDLLTQILIREQLIDTDTDSNVAKLAKQHANIEIPEQDSLQKQLLNMQELSGYQEITTDIKYLVSPSIAGQLVAHRGTLRTIEGVRYDRLGMRLLHTIIMTVRLYEQKHQLANLPENKLGTLAALLIFVLCTSSAATKYAPERSRPGINGEKVASTISNSRFEVTPDDAAKVRACLNKMDGAFAEVKANGSDTSLNSDHALSVLWVLYSFYACADGPTVVEYFSKDLSQMATTKRTSPKWPKFRKIYLETLCNVLRYLLMHPRPFENSLESAVTLTMKCISSIPPLSSAHRVLDWLHLLECLYTPEMGLQQLLDDHKDYSTALKAQLIAKVERKKGNPMDAVLLAMAGDTPAVYAIFEALSNKSNEELLSTSFYQALFEKSPLTKYRTVRHEANQLRLLLCVALTPLAVGTINRAMRRKVGDWRPGHALPFEPLSTSVCNTILSALFGGYLQRENIEEKRPVDNMSAFTTVTSLLENPYFLLAVRTNPLIGGKVINECYHWCLTVFKALRTPSWKSLNVGYVLLSGFSCATMLLVDAIYHPQVTTEDLRKCLDTASILLPIVLLYGRQHQLNKDRLTPFLLLHSGFVNQLVDKTLADYQFSLDTQNDKGNFLLAWLEETSELIIESEAFKRGTLHQHTNYDDIDVQRLHTVLMILRNPAVLRSTTNTKILPLWSYAGINAAQFLASGSIMLLGHDVLVAPIVNHCDVAALMVPSYIALYAPRSTAYTASDKEPANYAKVIIDPAKYWRFTPNGINSIKYFAGHVRPIMLALERCVPLPMSSVFDKDPELKEYVLASLANLKEVEQGVMGRKMTVSKTSAGQSADGRSFSAVVSAQRVAKGSEKFSNQEEPAQKAAQATLSQAYQTAKDRKVEPSIPELKEVKAALEYTEVINNNLKKKENNNISKTATGSVTAKTMKNSVRLSSIDVIDDDKVLTMKRAITGTIEEAFDLLGELSSLRCELLVVQSLFESAHHFTISLWSDKTHMKLKTAYISALCFMMLVEDPRVVARACAAYEIIIKVILRNNRKEQFWWLQKLEDVIASSKKQSGNLGLANWFLNFKRKVLTSIQTKL